MITIHKLVGYFIAMVWLINGLYCKVLNFVPRHELIVARILGEDNAQSLIRMIGLGEVFMALWIWSNWRRRACAVCQILLILTMNLIEFSLARDLLLWGPFNLVFAILFSMLVWWWGIAASSKT